MRDSPYQRNKSYLIVARRQANGDLADKAGYCGLGFSEDDIIAFIKTGNPSNAIPQGCIKYFRRAYKTKHLDGWSVSQDQICQQYMPALNRKYPNLVKKHAE
ncbi:MAG: hypothetical protein L3J65_03030 [Robiginitomaculum sp.]|nr:hypothetical protein [Robiginitomaculum sp.]